MNTIIALDPGNTKTGYVVYDMDSNKPISCGKIENERMLSQIFNGNTPIVCEFPYPRGQSISWQLIESIEWAGKFSCAAHMCKLSFTKMNRKDIKVHVAKSANAKDKHVRKALIEYFGGEKTIAGPKCLVCKGKKGIGRGKKKVECSNCKGTGLVEPGLLYEFSADCWAALAVAVTYYDCGSSKSSEVLMAESKDRKAQQQIEYRERRYAFEQQLNLLNQEMLKTMTAKQSAKMAAKGISLQKRIQKLTEKIK